MWPGPQTMPRASRSGHRRWPSPRRKQRPSPVPAKKISPVREHRAFPEIDRSQRCSGANFTPELLRHFIHLPVRPLEAPHGTLSFANSRAMRASWRATRRGSTSSSEAPERAQRSGRKFRPVVGNSCLPLRRGSVPRRFLGPPALRTPLLHFPDPYAFATQTASERYAPVCGR